MELPKSRLHGDGINQTGLYEERRCTVLQLEKKRKRTVLQDWTPETNKMQICFSLTVQEISLNCQTGTVQLAEVSGV